MKPRIGFLGAGLISRMHGHLLRSSSVAHEITAVHDPDRARAEAFAARLGAEAMSEEALLDSVDVAYVTAWTSEHGRLVRAAAERGLAVFCEKPLAKSAREAEAIVECVEAAGVVSQVGLVLRFVPQFLLARALVQEERAGRLQAVSFRDDQYIPNQGTYGSTWRIDPAIAGRGALLEHSIHDVDILRCLGGPVDAVSAVVREFHGYDAIDDVAVARLEFAGGGVASLTSVWHDILERPSLRYIELFCERLYVALDGDLSGAIRWQFTGSPLESLAGDALVRACRERGIAPSSEVASLAGSPLFNPATAFLEAVRGETPPALPLREAVVAHRLVDALYRSADQAGATIRAPEARLHRNGAR